MRKIYIDIDGVLLGKNSPDDFEVVLAKGAKEFLEFCLDNFDCYWLTTHCNQGDTKNIIRLFSQYADESVMSLIASIKPTCWKTLKTETIDFKSDFYWVEDQLMAYEQEILKNNNVFDRWIKVDTRKNPDDLLQTLNLIKNKL